MERKRSFLVLNGEKKQIIIPKLLTKIKIILIKYLDHII